MKESNPRWWVWKPLHYHYANPARCVTILDSVSLSVNYSGGRILTRPPHRTERRQPSKLPLGIIRAGIEPKYISTLVAHSPTMLTYRIILVPVTGIEPARTRVKI